MPPNAIPILVFSCVFGAILIILGRKLFSIRSYEKHLMAFKQNPAAFGWFEKYFLRWRLGGLQIAEWSTKALGDRLVSAFYRFTGILFITVAILFVFFALLLAFGK